MVQPLQAMDDACYFIDAHYYCQSLYEYACSFGRPDRELSQAPPDEVNCMQSNSAIHKTSRTVLQALRWAKESNRNRPKFESIADLRCANCEGRSPPAGIPPFDLAVSSITYFGPLTPLMRTREHRFRSFSLRSRPACGCDQIAQRLGSQCPPAEVCCTRWHPN